MIKPTKLKDEEFAEVQELQKEFQLITYQIGELSLIQHNLEKQLKEIETELDNFYSTSFKLTEKEKEIVDKLTQAYPDVNINFETGELS